MLAILFVIAPIFALIALGYLAVRFRAFPASGVSALIAFVNNFATPCLLFYAMATSDFRAAFNITIIAPFYVGAFLCFGLGMILSRRFFAATPGQGVSSGFTAMFSNTILIGLPVMQRAYGDAALPTVLSIIGIHGAILLTSAMIVMEFMRRDGGAIGQTLLIAGRRIGTNPLIWGIATGLLANFSGLQLIEPAAAFFSMMTQAVVPVALFGIGGALNEYRLSENWGQALILAIIKQMLHPAFCYILMIWVLAVPMEFARYGILLSAMPAGINAYVFATYYNRGIPVAASTILIGTIGSALTIAAWLYLLSL